MGHHHDREHRTKPPKIRRMHENDLLGIMSALLMGGANGPKDAATAVKSARALLKIVKDSPAATADTSESEE
jgi:hypothetical protein